MPHLNVGLFIKPRVKTGMSHHCRVISFKDIYL